MVGKVCGGRVIVKRRFCDFVWCFWGLENAVTVRQTAPYGEREPLVTPQVTFNQIPPAAAGGSFNPDLQDTENTLKAHRRQPVDGSFLTCLLNNGKQRLGMNHPPAAAGGIVGIF